MSLKNRYVIFALVLLILTYFQLAFGMGLNLWVTWAGPLPPGQQQSIITIFIVMMRILGNGVPSSNTILFFGHLRDGMFLLVLQLILAFLLTRKNGVATSATKVISWISFVLILLAGLSGLNFIIYGSPILSFVMALFGFGVAIMESMQFVLVWKDYSLFASPAIRAL